MNVIADLDLSCREYCSIQNETLKFLLLCLLCYFVRIISNRSLKPRDWKFKVNAWEVRNIKHKNRSPVIFDSISWNKDDIQRHFSIYRLRLVLIEFWNDEDDERGMEETNNNSQYFVTTSEEIAKTGITKIARMANKRYKKKRKKKEIQIAPRVLPTVVQPRRF